MNLFKNIKLVSDINKFYKYHYEGTYTKIQLKDLSNPAWLSEIQYDINEMLEDYQDENTQFVHFLKSINTRINQRSEPKMKGKGITQEKALLKRIDSANEKLLQALEEYFDEINVCVEELEEKYDHDIEWLDDICVPANKTECAIYDFIRRNRK